MSKRKQKPTSNYRWVIMALCIATAIFVFTMPTIALSVLFSEIAADLNLDLVQIGVIWAIASVMGMAVSLLGGSISDQIGTRRSLLIICLATGIFGGMRGFITDFTGFIVLSFLLGLFQQAMPPVLGKTIGSWFPRSQLGTANGMLSAGFGTGLMLGSFLSASILSPLFGGWRGVMFCFGAVAFIMMGLWFILYPNDEQEKAKHKHPSSTRSNLSAVLRMRTVWLIGLGALGLRGCMAGLTGYLPTYLRDIGWLGVDADNALAILFLSSIIFVIPISILSDRLGNRKIFLMGASLMVAAGAGLLFIGNGTLVIIGVIIAGFSFDGFMSIFTTSVLEVKAVGTLYAGTALGFAHMIRNFGGVISPPIGNSFASNGLNVPFAFWALMAIFGFIIFTQLPRKHHDPSVA